jgi:deoxyribose-phosphate aldolase
VTQAASIPIAQRVEVILPFGADRTAVESFCGEARRLGFYAVAVPTSRVELVRALLEGSDLKVIALIDYPFAAADSDVRRYETEAAADLGAHEIQMVLSTPRLKDGEGRGLLREMRDVVEAADERPVTYVLEPDLLTAEELRTGCELALDAGIAGITAGLISSPAVDPEFVRGLRSILGSKFQIKAAGVFAGPKAGQALLDAGADRVQATLESLRKTA